MLVWQEGSDIAPDAGRGAPRPGWRGVDFQHRGRARPRRQDLSSSRPPSGPRSWRRCSPRRPSIRWRRRGTPPSPGRRRGWSMPRASSSATSCRAIEHARLIVEFYTPRTRHAALPASSTTSTCCAPHETWPRPSAPFTNAAMSSAISTNPTSSSRRRRSCRSSIPILFRCAPGRACFAAGWASRSTRRRSCRGRASRTSIARRSTTPSAWACSSSSSSCRGCTRSPACRAVGGDAIPARIRAGHWPYARDEVPVQPSPHAPPWEVLPPTVQTLMRRCFEEGHVDPRRRPSAEEWRTSDRRR